MAFAFGPFKLDEAGRALTLADSEVALQPRVFDLLAYLVRNRERVVSKDELLDALWPGVNVTENSLQRVVSVLRNTLRDGGVEAALKNYPGKGYRFLSDIVIEESVGTAQPTPGIEPHARAFAEQRWRDAATLYASLDTARALNGQDLEKWGYALQCLGRPADAVPIFTRAVAAFSAASQPGQAARLAVELSTIHMERNEMAAAKGWAATAEDLLAADPDADEAGYLFWMQAKLAGYDGDMNGARDLADAAYNFGQRKAIAAIEALGLVYRGFYRVSLGETVGGVADQDRAAALALSQNVGPITGGVLYCNILWTCRAVGDWARASQWTLGYRQFCDSSRLEFSGSCQLHYAEVLGVRGSLKIALAHIQDAIARLKDDAPWALADAYRVLGDLQSAIGHDDSAMEAYEKAYALGWSADPGYSMLLLGRNDIDPAIESLEQSLSGPGWWNMQRRGILLAHLALAAARGGRLERAQDLIAELNAHECWGIAAIRALASEASAELAERRGEARDALRHLHLARQLWTGVESRYHSTRVRLKIAAQQLALGDRTAAAIELRAALTAAQELESDKLCRKCHELQSRVAG